MDLTRKHIAALLVVGGAGLLVAGVALVYVPAALAVGGVALVLLGLFGVELGDGA